MPRKNTMRDNVNAVRSELSHLSELSRTNIELALLYYESNVEETVQAFNRDGAFEALGGWTEMSNRRGDSSIKRTNNQPRSRVNKPVTLATTPSNGILRPSQRASNIFQIFAEGGMPTPSSTGSTTVSNTTTCSPSSVSSSSFLEQADDTLQSESNLSHVSTPVAPVTHEQTIDTQNSVKSPRRKSLKTRNNSISNKELSIASDNHPTPNNNKKILTKSTKDLQRQTSTLANVEVLFNNEIKSSIKRIDDIFKQLREIIKEREVQLYLEMDKVKEQGLNVIHRRQQRGAELRQRIDRCDRLDSSELDHLRADIKQFVTDRRYDLGEELTTCHRFEYDQTLAEALKKFGHVSTVERKRSISTSSALAEANHPPTTEPLTNGRTPSVSFAPTDTVITANREQPLSPRRPKSNIDPLNDDVFSTPTNNHVAGDYRSQVYPLPQRNGHFQSYADPNNHQDGNRRRPPRNSQGSFQGSRSTLNYPNGQSRRNTVEQMNGRVNHVSNSKATNLPRRPRPASHPSQSTAPVQT